MANEDSTDEANTTTSSADENANRKIYRSNGGLSFTDDDDAVDQGPETGDRVWYKDISTVSCIIYLVSLIVFLAGINVQSLPSLPYPLTGNLQDLNLSSSTIPDVWQEGVILVVVFYGAMYCRKVIFLIVETVLDSREQAHPKQNGISGHIHNTHSRMVYSTSRAGNSPNTCTTLQHNKKVQQCGEGNVWTFVGPALLYHIVFGFWLGWSCNVQLYNMSDSEFVTAGILTFVLGEILAYSMGFAYVMVGRRDKKRYRIGRELGDLASVLGIAVYSLTLAGAVMALMRVVLSIIGCCTHRDTRVF